MVAVDEDVFVVVRDALLGTLYRRMAIGNASYAWRDIQRTPVMRDYNARVQTAVVQRLVNEGFLLWQKQGDRFSLNPEAVKRVEAILRPMDLIPTKEDHEPLPEAPEGEATISPARADALEREMERLRRAVEAAKERPSVVAAPAVAMPDEAMRKKVNDLSDRVDRLSGKVGTLAQERENGGAAGMRPDAVRDLVDRMLRERVDGFADVRALTLSNGERVQAMRKLLPNTMRMAYMGMAVLDVMADDRLLNVAANLADAALDDKVAWLLKGKASGEEAPVWYLPIPLFLKQCAVCGAGVDLTKKDSGVSVRKFFTRNEQGVILAAGFVATHDAHAVDLLYDARRLTEADLTLGELPGFTREKPAVAFPIQGAAFEDETVMSGALSRFAAYMRNTHGSIRWE